MVALPRLATDGIPECSGRWRWRELNRWTCDLIAYRCQRACATAVTGRPLIPSWYPASQTVATEEAFGLVRRPDHDEDAGFEGDSVGGERAGVQRGLDAATTCSLRR